MYRVLLVAIVLGACAPKPSGHALPSLGLRVAGVDRPVDLASLPATVGIGVLQTKPPPYHGQAKRYRGVDLANLLREEGAFAQAGSLDRAVLTFVCADGYRSQLPARHLAKHHALLAWSEIGDDDKPMPMQLVQLVSGAHVDPAPLYVVWPESAIAETYPSGWPFAVLRIEVDSGAPSDPIDPSHLPSAATPVDAAVRAGFATWARVCFACHSLNGIGGRMGPELNVPLNVTEYFAAEPLQRYISDWAQVRAPHGNEKMPRFAALLSPQQIAEVVAYLRWMAGHKVAASAQ